MFIFFKHRADRQGGLVTGCTVSFLVEWQLGVGDRLLAQVLRKERQWWNGWRCRVISCSRSTVRISAVDAGSWSATAAINGQIRRGGEVEVFFRGSDNNGRRGCFASILWRRVVIWSRRERARGVVRNGGR